MTSKWTRFAAVAALALTAVSGQAMEYAQKVNLDFEFRTPAGKHAPGQYTVEARKFTGGIEYIYLINNDTRKAVMFMTQAPMQKVVSNAPPRLVFQCGASGCDLSEVWATSQNGSVIPRSKMAPADAERNTVAKVVPIRTAAD